MEYNIMFKHFSFKLSTIKLTKVYFIFIFIDLFNVFVFKTLKEYVYNQWRI